MSSQQQENLSFYNQPSKQKLPFQLQNMSKQFKQSQKIQQLKKWMNQKGCIIHPHIQIPALINGVQGVATNNSVPPKTLIIAVPSSLILTVSKCYKDPQLKSVFVKNDQLFDYEGSQDAQFSILCVFLMYHKLNIQKSPWKIYLQTIGEPETAIDWQNSLLKGLNKSLVEQILHVRIQCNKLRQTLTKYLKTTQQFKNFSIQQLRNCFNYCYRSVMTRCFGYYFNEASLIPVADLINHGCQTIDHQLINTKYQKFESFNQSYKQKSSKIDSSLLGIKKGKCITYPFRQRFLLQNKLIQDKIQVLEKLNRRKIDQKITQFNEKLFRQQNYDIEKLQFCEQNDEQDNDTDEQQQNQREIQLERLKTQQIEQIQNFKKYFESIKVETYKQVEDRYQKYQKELTKQSDTVEEIGGQNKGNIKQSKNDFLINEAKNQQKKQIIKENESEQIKQSMKQQYEQSSQQKYESNNESQDKQVQKKKQQITELLNYMSKKQNNNQSQDANNQSQQIFQSKTSSISTKPQQHQPYRQLNQKLSQSTQQRAIVPIQMVQSSQSQQSQDDEQWGLEPESYFCMSTCSAVAPNQQLFNSYGSRTNKFLLIWYGFCYKSNLYDSVSLRLHVLFTNKKLPQAKDIVLDTYVGGQGLTFRKNDKQQLVKGNQVSKQFRIKRNSLCLNLLTFLRLYLLQFYKGSDLYKICVTIPSSLQYQRFMFLYYKDIVLSLYERYPVSVIQQVKKQQLCEQTLQQDRQKIRFKIIYLQQQRNILDQHMKIINCVLQILNHPSIGLNKKELRKQIYKDFPIELIRKIKPYLMILKNNFCYLTYEHKEQKKGQQK